ncbi:hypothetical protein DL98DRAFT_635289 [Cadophora sp. DSE1049]|nr:hypothetical protein DL98DRAFT_635289 [Cadophora sp. DSE1049]
MSKFKISRTNFNFKPHQFDSIFSKMVSLDDMRPYKKARLLNSLDHVITLEVGGGDNPTKFAVHKAVLCSSSPFFESACKPEWMTAEDCVIKLPVDDPVAVQAMVYWMYHNVICIANEMDDLQESGTKEAAMKTPYGLFAKLFVLGEEYQMPRLRNHAIDAIIDRYENTTSLAIEINSYVYANTLDDSPLRKVVVGFLLHHYDKADIISMKKQLYEGLIFDLVAVLFDNELDEEVGLRRINCNSPADDFCHKFHVHCEKRSSKCKTLKPYLVDS